jgi:hypothetical protein
MKTSLVACIEAKTTTTVVRRLESASSSLRKSYGGQTRPITSAPGGFHHIPPRKTNTSLTLIQALVAPRILAIDHAISTADLPLRVCQACEDCSAKHKSVLRRTTSKGLQQTLTRAFWPPSWASKTTCARTHGSRTLAGQTACLPSPPPDQELSSFQTFLSTAPSLLASLKTNSFPIRRENTSMEQGFARQTSHSEVAETPGGSGSRVR